MLTAVPTPSLSLAQVKLVDTKLIDMWQPWVDAVPEAWKKYILNVTPLFVTCRYGQNREMGMHDDTIQEESELWRTMCDFSLMSRMTLALANDIEYAALILLSLLSPR